MKAILRIRTIQPLIASLMLVISVMFTSMTSAQVTLPCSDPSKYIYGLTQNGEIYSINMLTGVATTTVKNGTYSGNGPNRANGMGYNIVNSKFYYFKRAVGNAPQEFVSFSPTTNTVQVLAPSTCADEVHTGCVNYRGTGYYTFDIQGNFNYYNITTNTWTFITNNVVDQNGVDVDSVIRAQNSGDMAMDGYGNLWLVTSSNQNYGMYKIPTPLPTTAVGKLKVRCAVQPTTATPNNKAFAGIAFNPNGQIYMSTKQADRLYRMNDDLSLTFIATMNISDIGNDLTSCSFPAMVLSVGWTSFDATLEKNNLVKLNWEVVEHDNDGFYVQHSQDGSNWEDLAFVPSKNQTETSAEYSYNHVNNLNGKHYYRIRNTNTDGKETYSSVKIVTLQNNFNVSVWPNPTSDVLKITAAVTDNKNYYVNAQVIDLSGRTLVQQKLQPAAMNSVNISHLPKGTYILKIENSNGTTFNQKVSKQ